MSTDSTAAPAPSSQLQFTIDLSRVALFLSVLALTLLAGLAGAYLVRLPAAAPVVQPSVPSLIPPPLSACPGGCSKPVYRAFNVACPHCRQVFTVRPSETGASTEVPTSAVAKPASK